MITIYKYELKAIDLQQVEMPVGAQILSVGTTVIGEVITRDVLCLWAKVNTDNIKEARSFLICGTGHKLITEAAKFLGTTFMDNESVWHIFEVSNDYTC